MFVPFFDEKKKIYIIRITTCVNYISDNKEKRKKTRQTGNALLFQIRQKEKAEKNKKTRILRDYTKGRNQIRTEKSIYADEN